MRERNGWLNRDCAHALGCGLNQPGVWALKGAPTYIALACSALAANLPPWQRELDP